MIKISNIKLNLKDTITCGQIFRYVEENDNSYTVICSDRIVNLKMYDNNLIVKSNNEKNLEEYIRDYLDLNRNYDEINDFLIKKDPKLKEIINYCNGFKIMHTPKFETCISYILSSNNGVPQIKNSLNLISQKYGKKVYFNNKYYYLFPTLNELKNITKEDLRECKVGFRDAYIYEFIQKIFDKSFNLNNIDNMNLNDAMNYLMQIKGIGEKVSSCILLFAYSYLDVFPIDTWVKKYFKNNYNLNTVKEITDYSKINYDKYSGLVIQYIFNYSRNSLKEVINK